MIGEYRFFQEFFDGQIVNPESEKYKLFKLLLISTFSTIGLFLVFIGVCNIAEFLLLELGMIWNFYSGLGKQSSVVFSVAVSLLYFLFCLNFKLYANGIVYLACYIPLQLIAVSKDYSEGDYVQIKKYMSDYNKILFAIMFLFITICLCLVDLNFGSTFALYDGIVGGILICSAILRNERYFEYYIFRIFGLVLSIAFWILIIVEYGTVGMIAIVLMYVSYLIFDVVNLCVQEKTYVNQYMIQQQLYQKEEDGKLIKQKLKSYKKLKMSEEKNN